MAHLWYAYERTLHFWHRYNRPNDQAIAHQQAIISNVLVGQNSATQIDAIALLVKPKTKI